MRPAYRFALVAALSVGATALGWWFLTQPTQPVADRARPDPASLPAAERLEAERRAAEGEAATAADGGAPVGHVPTRDEVLDEIQRAEDQELGPDEAARRRRLREQMLDARAKHD